MNPNSRPPEEPDDPTLREREQLATMLALMLLITFGGAFVLFLIFVSLGLFFWVLVAGAVIAAYSGLHYLIWGWSSKGRQRESNVKPSSESHTDEWQDAGPGREDRR
jgi:hypothetical protein